MSILKNVIINVREPHGAAEKQLRIDLRDKIIKAAVDMGARVVDADPDIQMALIECTEDIKQKLSKAFPNVPLRDEVIAAQLPPRWVNRPKF